MKRTRNAASKAWYERSYRHGGWTAQRRYPNEELLRFFGRCYFALPRARRRRLRVLEVGCGSGANLWMIGREGFATYGIDLSAKAIALCRKMADSWDIPPPNLKVADMTAIPYPDGYFDVIVDVFSSYCLDNRGHARFLDEIARLLRPGGRFFTYTPSKASDAFKKHAPSRMLDRNTLDGIRRKTSPFSGNLYPFRFTTGKELRGALARRNLRVVYDEIVGRTYRGGREYFEFVVMAAEKLARPVR